MGQDKALLAVDGEALIRRTCRVVLAVASPVYVVTGWGDRYRSLLPPPVQLLAEPGEARGPLVALGHALGHIQGKWALAVACDLPNLSAAALGTWAAHLDALPTAVMAYLPRRDDRWEPLCGFYRKAAAVAMQRYGAAGERSLQRWLHQQTVVAIPAVDESLLTNLNTPTDWAKWASQRPPTPGL